MGFRSAHTYTRQKRVDYEKFEKCELLKAISYKSFNYLREPFFEI